MRTAGLAPHSSRSDVVECFHWQHLKGNIPFPSSLEQKPLFERLNSELLLQGEIMQLQDLIISVHSITKPHNMEFN